MAYNVGDIEEFQLVGGPANPPNLAFVWAWWDGTTDVTQIPLVDKTINMGGNPLDALNGSNFQLRFSATVVDDIGQNAVYPSVIVANNPPSVVFGSARLSVNDGVFPFATHGTVAAYDLENQPLSFAWYGGGQFLGSGTNSLNYGHTAAFWNGTSVGNRTASLSGQDFMAATAGSLVCYIFDTGGGTTIVDFPLYGKSPQSITLSSAASVSGISADASGTPQLRVGANQFAEFVVYTPVQTHPLTFQWAYFGSNGWAQTLYSNGTTTAFGDGSFQNVDIKSVASESPGQKIAECFVRDSLTGQISAIDLSITLLANSPPAIASVDILPVAPNVGDFLSFSANASDSESDLIHYTWQFTSPVVINLYGRKVIVNTGGGAFPHGQRVVGVLTATDNLGAASSLPFQSAPLT